MPDDTISANGACHCGAVQFAARLPRDLGHAGRCNCSFCRMRGAVTLTTPLDGLTIRKGEDALTLYQFGTGTARHFFCRHCGIYTHHQRRSDPRFYGINAACIEGVSPFDFAEIPVSDGIHHESDGHESRLAGILRFDARA